VSTETSANANLDVQKAEIDAAVAQASRFSSVCNVWAPMYRQATVTSIAEALSGAPGSSSTARATFDVAYASLLAAWKSFAASDSAGRPIVLIGHSQGSGSSSTSSRPRSITTRRF